METPLIGSFLLHEMSKYIALAALFVGLGTLKIGVIEGVVDSYTYEPSYSYTNGSALVSQNPVTSAPKSVDVFVTAYSSRVEETDSTPFITASGSNVRTGVVAANWLPFGTKIRIPELFGEKIFTVEDRMHRRNADKMDVWFPTTEEALRFGTQVTRVEIL